MSKIFQFEGDGREQCLAVDSMLGRFTPKGAETLTVGKTKLNTAIQKEREKFLYTYDFGDNWQHSIMVEKILKKDSSKKYPVCIGGERACPPEDCGSVPRYYELMEIRQDKKHPFYEERIVEWLGETFDPEKFDIEKVNEKLRHTSSKVMG